MFDNKRQLAAYALQLALVVIFILYAIGALSDIMNDETDTNFWRWVQMILLFFAAPVMGASARKIRLSQKSRTGAQDDSAEG